MGGGAPLKPGLRNQQIIHFQNLKSRTSSGIRRMSFSYIGEIVKRWRFLNDKTFDKDQGTVIPGPVTG